MTPSGVQQTPDPRHGRHRVAAGLAPSVVHVGPRRTGRSRGMGACRPVDDGETDDDRDWGLGRSGLERLRSSGSFPSWGTDEVRAGRRRQPARPGGRAVACHRAAATRGLPRTGAGHRTCIARPLGRPGSPTAVGAGSVRTDVRCRGSGAGTRTSRRLRPMRATSTV